MKLRLVLSICLIIMFASKSFGQDTPAFEASLGFSFLREEPNLNRYGWLASAARNVNNALGVKGEIGSNYTNFFHRDAHSFLAGAQFTARRKARVTPWSHFLLGVVRTGQGTQLDFFSELFRPGAPLVFVPANVTHFAIQPGGGVDLWLSRTFGIRLGADYRRLNKQPFHRNAGPISFDGRDYFRLHTGMVFRTRPR
jgi:hypothetical protein